MIKLIKPTKWGNDYALDENSFPYKKNGDEWIEVAPINVPKDFNPKVYKESVNCIR